MAGKTEYDFVIIGAGFGGLSSAALLAAKGKKILLLEKEKFPGGRASFYEKDGFLWQYGQHSHRLGPDGMAAEVMKRLGEPLQFYKPAKEKAKIFYRGKLYDRPEGVAGFLTTKALSFRARIRFLKFYVKILRLDPADWFDKTLLELYRSVENPDSEVEGFLNFLGFTIMLPDSKLVSAGEVIDFLQRVSKVRVPVADVPGGSKQIISRLENSITRNGGEIHYGEAVTSIVTRQRRVCGVNTVKKQYSAENVVYAAPVKGIEGLVKKGTFPREFLDYISGIKHSGGVIIDFVSKEPLADYDGGILGVDEPLWVKFQTLFDKTVAPEGYHVCSWGLLTEWGKAGDKEAVRKTEKRLREIASICMPGFEKKVIRERKLVVPVVNAGMLIPQQSRPHRPAVKSPYVDGLFLAGDTVQGEFCSGDIAFSSALKIADMVI